MSISDKDRRSFYEKECARSGWSVRELKRQVSTSLYERLLLTDGNVNNAMINNVKKRESLNRIGANRLKVLPEESLKYFISLVMMITLPCLVVSSITEQEINGSMYRNTIYSTLSQSE